MSDWPDGMMLKPIVSWPGTPTRNRGYSPFTAEWSSTLTLLRRELDQLRATDRILQIDMDESMFRIDGFPRANARSNGPGVIVTFDALRTTLSYPCDAFLKWQDNVRAIALGLEALRKVERYGITKRNEQYMGFKALPPGSIAIGSSMSYGAAATELVTLAGLDQFDEGLLRKVRNVKDFRDEVYRKAARRHHPDASSGDGELFKKLNDAKTILDRGPVAG